MPPRLFLKINPRLAPALFVQPKTGQVRMPLLAGTLVCASQCLIAIVAFCWLGGFGRKPDHSLATSAFLLSARPGVMVNAARIESDHGLGFEKEGYAIARSMDGKMGWPTVVSLCGVAILCSAALLVFNFLAPSCLKTDAPVQKEL
ncbi:hypothetical protein F5Y18DRAFT_79626 [Xylariaceae sp. FL1019]|nr:hypothetical protein F5Y18DRAFT_79626 [Xylariaceae sp. FL1019]